MMEEPRRWQRHRIRYLLPILIVLVGILIMVGLRASRKHPPRERVRPTGALVEVIEVRSTSQRIVVEGNGTVAPRYEITLMPQVTGKVVWVHPDLVAGGAFREGDELLRIEQVDYALAVQRAAAQVAQAEYQLEVARAKADIARREWELMNAAQDRPLGDPSAGPGRPTAPAQPHPLVLHEPQLRQAQANLTSAGAALETAQLNLERTVLRAPFNCRVRRQAMAPGQLVGPASQVAVLYATDLVEIEVGLPVADLAWIELPGAPATVRLDTGEGQYTWAGRADRTVGVVDEIGRLARVVVQVRDPFRRSDPATPELSIGSFVLVEIAGRLVEGTIPVPRRALRENSTVWVAAKDNTLEIREIKLHRLTPTEALVAAGLTSGERIILTPLSGAVQGMTLRLVQAEVRR